MTEVYQHTREELKSLYGLDRDLTDEEYSRSYFRTEEPLKGYRQWCLDELVEKFNEQP